MDRATQDYLLSVADSVAASRVLLVLTYRPGYVHPFGERSYHTRLALNALSNEDSVQMAQGVLAAASLPDDLRGVIVRKAEGNPFYIEEVVKSLHEVGAIRRLDERYVLARPLDEILVPDTIQDVIMARIDRLEDPSKKALQLASVIGREFTRRLLERIADMRGRAEELLGELKAIELIYEKSVFPELAYMFKHALTHDVAYNSLLVQRRRELHRTIGLTIEELYTDRLAEHYEVLAYHFLRGEEWERALHYLRDAAAKAAARSAFQRRRLTSSRRSSRSSICRKAESGTSRRSTSGSPSGARWSRPASMAAASRCSPKPRRGPRHSATSGVSGESSRFTPIMLGQPWTTRAPSTSAYGRWPLPTSSKTCHSRSWPIR
jgi:predicted ATPase